MKPHQEWPTVLDVYEEGQTVTGRKNFGPPNLGLLHPGSPEDRRFRGMFGVSAHVVVDAWKLMEFHGVLPDNPQLSHLLWALAFMCTYPKNDKVLSTLLGNKDPKTINKYMWPFIRAVFELVDYVVSCFGLWIHFFFTHNVADVQCINYCHRSYLRTGKKMIP